MCILYVLCIAWTGSGVLAGEIGAAAYLIWALSLIGIRSTADRLRPCPEDPVSQRKEMAALPASGTVQTQRCTLIQLKPSVKDAASRRL